MGFKLARSFLLMTTWVNNFTNPFPVPIGGGFTFVEDGMVEQFIFRTPAQTASLTGSGVRYVEQFDVTFNVVAEDPIVLFFNIHANPNLGTDTVRMQGALTKSFNAGVHDVFRATASNNIVGTTGSKWTPLQLNVSDVPAVGSNRYRFRYERSNGIQNNFQNGNGFSYAELIVRKIDPAKISTATSGWTWEVVA